MNTERFKFRFWYTGYPHHNDAPEMFYNAEKVYDDGCRGDNELSYESFTILIDEHLEDRGILMQSTGLRDKNGKLIYEGDILQTPTKSGEYNLIVYFKEDLACFMLKYSNKIEQEWGLKLTMEGYEETQIIGNIYENPELVN